MTFLEGIVGAPRSWVWVVGIIVFASLVYLSYPVLLSFYFERQIKGFVKITMDYPGCSPQIEKETPLGCKCELVLEDEMDPSRVRFEGSSLHYSYEPEMHSYRVTGFGRIQDGANTIQITSTRIAINTTELPPDRPSSWFVLIRRDGHLRSSRWDLSW